MKLAGLLDYFRKPQGRAASHAQYIEIIVTRTGHPAHMFRINLDYLKKAGMALGAVLLTWFTGTFYVAYSHVANMEAIASADQQAETIAQLNQSNEQLQEEKQNMGQNLFSLQKRVEQLAERVHGIVNSTEDRFPVEKESRNNQGGVAIPLNRENASEIMNSEFSSLNDRLSDLLPSLENSVARETARPVGLPISSENPMTSDYGLRGNPFGRGHEFHNGIDFSADTGTPVFATAPGVVDGAGNEGAIGNRISIDHGFGYRSVYGHLSKLKVKTGERVSKGQVIGLSGNTGRSSGPHLHYTLYYRGRTIDPERYLQAN